MVTHDHEEAFTVADRLAVMRDGRLVQQGPIDDVWRDPVDAATALFLGYARVLEGERPPLLAAAAGLPPRPGGGAAALRAVGRRPGAGRPRSPAPCSRRGSRPSRCGSWSTSTALGRVDAVAPLGVHPGPGERVRLTVDRTRLAAIQAGADAGPPPRLTLVYRRAYVLLVGTASAMGALAVIAALVARQAAGRPRGLPRAVVAAAAAAAARGVPARHAAAHCSGARGWTRARWPEIVRERVRTHWTRERLTLVVMGLVCFYITYVSYRNLKSFLPFVMGDAKYDRELHLVDKALFLGSEPGQRPARHARHQRLRPRAVRDLPVVPAAGAARPHRLADLVAQHLLRLLVRHLAVHRLDARHRVVLRAADARARASATPGSTRTWPTPRPRT